MKVRIHSVSAHLYRILIHPILWLGVALEVYLLLQPIFIELLMRMKYGGGGMEIDSVLGALSLSTNIGGTRDLEPIVYSFIAAQTYIVERKSGYLRASVLREGTRRYLGGCLASTCMAAAVIAVIGLMLFALILVVCFGATLLPTEPEIAMDLGISGNALLFGRTPWLIWGVVGISYIFAITGHCLCALAVSAVSNNLFVVVLSPMLIYYVLANLTSPFLSPMGLDYVYLGRGMTRIDAPLQALAVTAAGYLPVILIAAVVFYLAASWRMRHE